MWRIPAAASPSRWPTAALLAGLALVAGLLAGPAPAGEAPGGSPRYAGMPLADALLDLRSQGLKIVFTTELVRPAMRVGAEPVATEPRAILDELLAPHGLVARDGPRHTLVVVQREAVVPTPEPPPGDVERPVPPVRLVRLPVLEETVVVTPSRVSLLREGPAATMGLSRDEILALPHLGDDFFRAVSLLPGVAANDYSARFHVRGGRRDETQILLDGQELYEAFHLKDYDSALSFVASSTLGSADLSTGGFSAEFGDRMSGVLDMKTLDPSGPPRGQVGASVLSLQAGGAGGFRGDRGSWLAEVRRGSTDLVEDLLGDEDPRYGDAYGKLEYRLGDRNSLRLNLLHTDDELRFSEVEEDGSKETETDYRSAYFWLTHRVVLGSRILLDTGISRTGIDQDRRGVELEEDARFLVRDVRQTEVLGLRQAWNFQVTPANFLRWGFELRRFDTEYDYFSRRNFDTPLAAIRHDGGDGAARLRREFEEDHGSLYVVDRLEVAEPLTLELGLRYDRHTLTDDHLASPRLNLAWSPGPATVLRLAWGRFNQSQRPYELQVEDGETRFYPTERSEHRVLGFERVFPRVTKGGGLAMRAEIYERRVSNPRRRYENLYEALNTFPEAEPDRVRLDPDDSVARGVELFLQGRVGPRLGWWANYAYATTEDTIDGNDVSRSIDQRHTLNLDLDYRVGRHWHLNLAWRFHTGWPTTPLSVRETLDEQGATVYVPVLGPLYSERLRDYHRLDLRASREFLGGNLVFFIDVQNVYDRDNIAGFDVQIDEADGTIVLEEEFWAGILPSVGITYAF